MSLVKLKKLLKKIKLIIEKTTNMAFTLSTNEVLKDAQRIHEFRGDKTFALTSFLREVDTIFLLVQSNPNAKEYIYQRIILNKLQGEALDVVRTLGINPKWEDTKEALIANFGVKETYHQLYQEAFSARNYCIVSYFKYLREILCKLNEKYEYDNEKPVEFSPANAEKIILKTFLNNIDVNLASVVINRNITKLRDAYNLLEREGLIRNETLKSKSNVNQNRTPFNNNRAKDFSKNSNGNNNSNNRFNQNSFSIQDNFSSNAGNNSNRVNRFTNSGNFNSQDRNTNYTNFQNNQRYSSQNNSGHFRQNNNAQMEIDHIQMVENNCDEQVNFHTIAYSRHFP